MEENIKMLNSPTLYVELGSIDMIDDLKDLEEKNNIEGNIDQIAKDGNLFPRKVDAMRSGMKKIQHPSSPS